MPARQIAVKDTTAADNLAVACKPCNRDKGSKTLEEWRAKK